ncbi:Conjugal transfer protein TrbG [Burkholderia diffusa]|uniref:TrbG/VirB9 family P-type conjugative transfer protein n=1 Tax=Burkholderia diffusa TaxID=488732 RepID=UPI001CAC480C|nr:TrbG/VirB9 family P-type conjugative transfer protein [Burkholderia diffusa]CAG9264341.1 Conjugal transfer protein TrbG [Burkholderia diffusa]
MSLNRYIRCGVAAATLLAGLAPTIGHTETTPGACLDDARIRCATYVSGTVYHLPYRPGKSAVLMLEKDEMVQGDFGLSMGDAEAWKVGVRGNSVTFKPKAPQAETNFMITTTKRVYAVHLTPARRNETETWVMTFDYPSERSAADAKRAAKVAAARTLLSQTPHVRGTVRNADYDMRGDTVLAPTAMWDDGRFTYFQYSTSRDLPEIYRVLPDGSEALANSDMKGDIRVVHDTAPSFVLRLGQSVLGIRNNAYTPDGPVNPSGTTEPNTARLLKKPEVSQ